MRFSSIFSSLLSLAAIAAPFANAQGAENNENLITKPAAGEVWIAGTPFPIEWTASANPGTVSIVLVKGVPGNLQVLETIAPNVANNGRFEWTPPLTLEGMQTMAADQVYQFKIVSDDSGNFGFSPSFKIDSPASTFAPTGAPANPAETSSTTDPAAPTETPVSSVESSSTSEIAQTTETSSEVLSSTTSAAESSSETSATSASITESPTASETTASETSSAPTTLSTAIKTSSEESTTEPTSSATETPDPTSSSSPSETTSSSPSSSSEPSSGLPAGVIAGITGGVIAFVILAIVGVFLFRRRKQQSRTKLRGETPPPQPSKYDRDFQMMERRARHRPTSSFGFNTSRSDTSGGMEGRNDPYVQLNDRESRRGSGTWGASRF